MREAIAGKNNPSYKHGRHGTKEYRIWKAMKTRCYNPNTKDSHIYFEKGIQVCHEWINDFNRFYEDMGPCPVGHTLDRIDSNKNYTPSNCRWADHLTQGNNTSRNVLYEYKGRFLTIPQWSRELGLDFNKLRSWMRNKNKKYPVKTIENFIEVRLNKSERR